MSDRTIVGVESLRSSNWAPLRNKRTVALVHAASALPDTLTHTVDAIAADGLKLAAILAPEHGFRGDRQAEHGDPKPYVDTDTAIAQIAEVFRDTGFEATSITDLEDATGLARARLYAAFYQLIAERLTAGEWETTGELAAVAGRAANLLEFPGTLSAVVDKELDPVLNPPGPLTGARRTNAAAAFARLADACGEAVR